MPFERLNWQGVVDSCRLAGCPCHPNHLSSTCTMSCSLGGSSLPRTSHLGCTPAVSTVQFFKARTGGRKQCPTQKTSAAGCASGTASRLVRPCGSDAGAHASPMLSASRYGSCTPRVAGVLRPVAEHPACLPRQSTIVLDSFNHATQSSSAGAACVQGGDTLQLLPAAAAGLAASVPGPAACAARHDGGCRQGVCQRPCKCLRCLRASDGRAGHTVRLCSCTGLILSTACCGHAVNRRAPPLATKAARCTAVQAGLASG